MTTSEEGLVVSQEFPHIFVEQDPDVDSGAYVLFSGDRGSLSYAQRKVLMSIMKNRFISRSTHPEEWATLTSHEAIIRSQLNNLFLDLHVDVAESVAFKRQAVPEVSTSAPFPTLLHNRPYTKEETIILVFLRQKMISERAVGSDEVIIDRQELIDHVASFRPKGATNISGDENRAQNAVESLLQSKILIKTSDQERVQIIPIIHVLLPLPKLQTLLECLQRLASGTEDLAAVEYEVISSEEGLL